MTSEMHSTDFFEYWETFGFFDNLQMSLPREFFVLFEIARLISTQSTASEALNAIEELSRKETDQNYSRDKSISVDRLDKSAALSDKMEIQNYKTIYDLKKALPHEIFLAKSIFDIKLLTKTLQVQKHFESDTDKFIPISPMKNDKGQNKIRFEQKFYLLFDRSRSMENRMRSFYSKTIVAEFLRRKLESNARLYFRPFDSKPGSLFKIEKKEDFPALIEKVIFTTTGGTSTNMQQAVLQAVNDISYDKEMADAEILVITDGLVHDLDVEKMNSRLKDIKLNILKIGLDLAEPDGFEVRRLLKESGYNSDAVSVSIKEIKKKMSDSSNKNGSMSNMEQRIYEFMLSRSDKIIKDVKSISHKFIEIDDIDSGDISPSGEDSAGLIEDALNQLLGTDLSSQTVMELALIYKKAYFLSQYIEFLKSGKRKDDPVLMKSAKDISSFKEEILSNPGVFDIISKEKGFGDDKKLIKSSRNKAKKNLRQMELQSMNLTKDEIKNAKLIFSLGLAGGGSGNAGEFLRVLLIKLLEIPKKIMKYIFTRHHIL